MSSKSVLRKEKLFERSSLTEKQVQRMSLNICKSVKEYIGSEKVGLFYPIKNEVDLLSLVNENSSFPRVIKDMSFYKFEGKFVKGKYNIPEPTGELTEVQTLIVPGSVFDLKGYRIGYGGGYYDKYLKSNHLKIGVCFDFQVVDELPIESHDVKLDMLITEKRIINFKE